MRTRNPRRPGRQSGVALFVALVFLVVLTLLGVAALNSNTMQLKMAGGAAQTNFAFQAAETAVRAGEAWMETQATRPLALCTTTCPNTSAIWPRVGLTTPVVTPAFLANSGGWFDTNGRLFSSTVSINDSSTLSPSAVASQPRYVVEELGPDLTGSLVVGQGTTYHVYYYQISGRGVGSQTNINTVVQSVYAKGY